MRHGFKINGTGRAYLFLLLSSLNGVSVQSIVQNVFALKMVAQKFEPLVGKNLTDTITTEANHSNVQYLHNLLMESMNSALLNSELHENALEETFRRRVHPNMSSYESSPEAVSQFCDGKHGVFPTHNLVAVCLVGLPRSFERKEFRDALRLRFLSGLGSHNAEVFAVFSLDPSMSHTQKEMTTILQTEFRYLRLYALCDP